MDEVNSRTLWLRDVESDVSLNAFNNTSSLALFSTEIHLGANGSIKKLTFK
jgi:hypothetical protein